MRLRTQLVLASFLLAILPLTAIVFYSYQSSKHALESAYRHEAARLTRQMDTRLSSIRGELDTRLADVSALPLQNLPDGSKHPVVDEVVMAMGDIAPLVDAVEFQPERENPDPNPKPAPAEAAPAAPAPPKPPQMAEVALPVHVEPPPPPMLEPIVIDLPQTPMPHFNMPPDYGQRIKEITSLAREMAKSATMTEEQRQALGEAMKQKNEELQKLMTASRDQYQKDLAVAMAARDAERERRMRAREERRRQMLEQQNAEREAQAPAPQPVFSHPLPANGERVREAGVRGAAKETVVIKRKLTDSEKQILRDRARQVSLLLGHDFALPVQSGGRLVGHVAAQISPDEVVRRVLGTQSPDDGEIPFAVDREGHLYTRNDAERQKLTGIGVPERLSGIPNWIVVVKNAGTNGMRVGVARRVGEDLEELRRTAGHNFGYGMVLVFVALIGIVPVANHMTRDVSAIALGAERVAQGDLMTRVPVRSKNEFGQLAMAFNRMAHDLSEHQQRMVQQRILAVEYERKAGELEEARRFQLSMLPKDVPHLDRFDVAVFTQTATEVGGDYYDFHVDPNGALTVAIGDATGHGAKAGTMVTVIKTLFSGYSGAMTPAAFLSSAAEKIKRMDLGRMAMALSIARFDSDRLTVASAGMPPVLIHRASTGLVEELVLEATPLGTLGTDYKERSAPVGPRDTVLFMSDGLPELTNESGQQLGYGASAEAFDVAARAGNAQEVLDRLVDLARKWHGDQPPNDDMTFVAVRLS